MSYFWDFYKHYGSFITRLLFFSHENNQMNATRVNQPYKPLDKMFNSVYIDFKGILSKKRGSALGLSGDE